MKGRAARKPPWQLLMLALLAGVHLVVPGFVATARAATLAVEPSRDTTLFEDSLGATSNGAGEYLFAGANANGAIRRGLLRFELGGIAPGSAVVAVSLRLDMSQSTSGAQTLSLHRAAASWGEGTSNSGGGPTMGGGTGAAAMPGDATWHHRFFSNQTWVAQGGDFSAVASASQSVGPDGQYTWNGPALVADVQAFVDDPSNNHGWLLRGNESQIRTAKRFHTREHASAATRPLLLVEYTPPVAAAAVPVPPWAALLLAAVCAVAGAARRRRS
jgi:hypothetical protein